eukprot:s877_g6.t2
MAIVQSRRFIWCNVVLALWLGTAEASQEQPTPLSEKSTALKKVTQLLAELTSQLKEDKEADQKQFSEYEKLTKASITSATATVEQCTTQVAELKASIVTAEALQAEKKSLLETAASNLLQSQKELELAKQQRLTEKDTFVKNAAQLQKSTDNLNLALQTVKSMSDGAGASGLLQSSGKKKAHLPRERLLAATSQLQTALSAGADELLTANQQHFLSRLLTVAGRSRKAQTPPAAVGFLQMASDRKAENDGSVDEDLDGEAPAIGDLSETLKQVKAETETELAATQVAEEKSRKNFAELTKTLEEEVATRQAAVDEVKAAISTSEEAAGKAESDLLSVNRRLSSTKQQLTELQVDLKDKSKDFATRGKSRDAEAGVVAEALAILTKSSSGATVEENAKTLASFLQLSSEAWGSHHSSRERELSRRKVARLLESAASPGLAALLLQSQEGGRRDVFKKVKALIHEMLAKMNEQQAQDARRDSWCQTELSNTNNAKASKATRADKLKTKMLAVTAELSSLKSEIETSAKDIDDMKASMGKAESQRAKESAKAKADVVMYEEDQRVLREAILVLQRVYGDTSVKADKSGYKAKATGSGVVGLLQVSLENFADLAEETAKGEKEAKADFQELKTTTEVRLATFVKDTEYKKQTITKLESELVRANEDLASYQKEIKALSTYLEELATSCSVKGLSFEERKAKREEQLASLKEALRVLQYSLWQ